MRLLEVVRLDVERAKLVRAPAVVPHATALERRDLDVLGRLDRELEEAAAHLAEELRVARGQEAVRALAAVLVLDPLPRERLRDLARGLLRREDERHAAAEHALEDRADERVVRAAEDDRVDVRLLERRRVLAHGRR